MAENNKSLNSDLKRVLDSIDQSVLKTSTTLTTVLDEAAQAKKYGFRALVIHPTYTKELLKSLKGSNVKAVSVCDFPHGRGLTKTRVFEIEELISLGIDEIDIVTKYYLLKDKDYDEYANDIEKTAEASKTKKIKYILEIDMITIEEIIKAVEIISNIAINNKYEHITIKTRTGFSDYKLPHFEIVKEIIETLKEKNCFGEGKITVKASGGIKNLDDAIKFINLGVSYIGTSSGLEIISGFESKSGY